MRSVINLQHVFHARYECGVGIRRDDPLLFQMGFKNAFFAWSKEKEFMGDVRFRQFAKCMIQGGF